MKKISTLLAVAAMAFTAQAADNYFVGYGDFMSETGFGLVDIYSGTEVAECDGMAFTTLVDDVPTPNGLIMYLVKEDKTYSGGITNNNVGMKSIKLSNGAPNLVVLPEGFTVNTIEVYGYCNDKTAGNVSWIASVLNEAGEPVYEGTAEGTTLPRISEMPGYAEFTPEGAKKDDEFWGKFTLEQMPKITCTLSQPVTGKLWFKNGGKQPCLYINFLATKDDSAISNIIADDANAPVEYFNLQGVRVENPANGLYIKRQGNTVTKVIVK